MRRWSKKPLNKLSRGLTAFMVCFIVALPLLLVGYQVSRALSGDGRKATPLPAFQPRKIDNSSVPKLFQEPLISITFDDGWETVYTEAAPLLNQYGIHSTQYILSGTENYPGYLSWAQIGGLQKAGQEIACHSVTHPDLTTLSDADLSYELNGCKTTMSQRFGPIYDFASPYGAANARTITAIKKFYQSQRNIDGTLEDGVDDSDVNLPANFDRYNIIGVSVHSDTTVAQLKQAVNYAVAHNGWLVLVYHQSEDGNSALTLDVNTLKGQLAYLSHTNLRIVTVNQVISTLPGGQK